MTPIGILADDLTGATDTGVQFARVGADVLVLAGLERLPEKLNRPWDVLVVNSDSRNNTPTEARSRVRTALDYLEREKCPLMYKKVDSTLRGNLAPELEVVLEGGARGYLAPAFPLIGRTVEDGCLWVDGVPLHRSEMGGEGRIAVHSSRVADLIGTRLGGGAGAISVAQVEQGAAALGRALEELSAEGAPVVICDATTQEHLGILAEALLPRLRGAVIVGSAGMAREMAARLVTATTDPPAYSPRTAGALLVVAGSFSSVTKSQAEYLAAQEGVSQVMVDPASLDGACAGRQQASIMAGAVSAARSRSSALLLRVADAGKPEAKSFRARSLRLNRFLGETVSRIARHPGLRGIVLTGGDIAAACIAALGAYGVRLGSEVAPGIPQGWLVGGDHDGLPVVTKAGAFGGEDALWRCALSLGGRADSMNRQ